MFELKGRTRSIKESSLKVIKKYPRTKVKQIKQEKTTAITKFNAGSTH